LLLHDVVFLHIGALVLVRPALLIAMTCSFLLGQMISPCVGHLVLLRLAHLIGGSLVALLGDGAGLCGHTRRVIHCFLYLTIEEFNLLNYRLEQMQAPISHDCAAESQLDPDSN